MSGSIADGDDEWKPESFAVSGVQAVETREVLAASSGQRPHFLLGGRILRQGTVARLFAGSSGCALSRPIGRVVLPTRRYCASLARATSFAGPGGLCSVE